MRDTLGRQGTTAIALSTLLLAACSGGGGTPVTGSSPTPLPSGATSAYACPTSAGAASAAVSASSGTRRHYAPRRRETFPSAPAGLIAVTYTSAFASTSRSQIAGRERALGASLQKEYEFPHAGLVTRVLAVPPAQAATLEAALRTQPGVRAAGPAGLPRYPSSVTSPYFTSDPYFTGFTNTVPPTSGATAPPATFEVGPLEENSGVPGQWDMHAIRLEHAFAYSQPGNGSGVSSAKALGSSAVKIAVIDTGEDSTHPELHGKIVYQKCFITNPSGTQSTSNFATDTLGHGTDVSGLAAADTGNGFGFTGTGGNVLLYGYRVVPTPDDNCVNPQSTDPQCGIDDRDIVSALTDATAQQVNVINLSLGGASCRSAGVDPDPLEGAAIADAIAANIIVVAASGNDSKPGSIAALEAPACDQGVIAAGATGLADGQPNGAGNSSGSVANPIEYVASYSNAGSPGAAAGSSAAWGIVAPGGDPAASEGIGTNPIDQLHWIDNIWTTTPYQSSPSDQSFTGACFDDYPSFATTPPVDCQVSIAGTSMSAPHIAGASALIVSVNPAYQSASAMKQLLCATADDIGDPNEGCGRLNVYRAMAAALNDPNPPPAAPSP